MKKVITIYGADSKVGVTMLCESLSKELSNISDGKKVLLIHADGEVGMNFHRIPDMYGIGLDNIKAKLLSEVITKQEFLDCCINEKNLYILPGSLDFGERKYYQPKQIETLIKIANEYFDLIVFDAGSNLDIGLTVGALINADIKILITTQNISARKRYLLLDEQILKKMMLSKFDAIVVNKYMKSNNLPRKKDIVNDYEIEELYTVPYSGYGMQAEQEEIALEALDDNYSNSIMEISQLLYKTISGEMKENIYKEKKNLFYAIKKHLKKGDN